MENVYFELTRAFNADGAVAVLTSGQAAVYHRVAIMSKDGDWLVRETEPACRRVLDVLEARHARYRPAAPLDVRWLAGGWSSHLEFRDERGRRVRCDFMSRPPRISPARIARLLAGGCSPASSDGELLVVDVEALIQTKRTRRSKDYAVISELARLLPERRELELTFDPDRILELAPRAGETAAERPAVRAALDGRDRESVAVALSREANALQEADRERLEVYVQVAREYLEEFGRRGLSDLPLAEAHGKVVELALEMLPPAPAKDHLS